LPASRQPNSASGTVGSFIGGLAVDVGAAVGQESGQPAPLVGVELRLEAQRPVFLEQPLQGFHRHTGIGQRRHVAIAELAAILVAGGGAHAWRAIEQGDLVPGFQQPPGRGQADDTAADYDDFLHPGLLTYIDMPRA
jgi:hypothetical protein